MPVKQLDEKAFKPFLLRNFLCMLGVLIASLFVGAWIHRLGGEYAAARQALNSFLTLLCIQLFLLDCFLKQKDINLYSYRTVYFLGCNFFLVGAVLTNASTALGGYLHPETVTEEYLMKTLVQTSHLDMYLSLPFVLIFAVALSVSNVSLVRHEGKHPVNLLGFALGIFLIVGNLLGMALDQHFMSEIFAGLVSSRYFLTFTNVYSVMFVYLESLMLGMMICSAIAARREPSPDMDYVIILGCSIRRDGTPTPLLRGRVDRALDFARRQLSGTGKSPALVVSGGKGSDEVVSEAEAMAGYLKTVSPDSIRVVQEARSTSTQENMRFSGEIIRQENPEAKVAFSTTNYHVFRSGMLARQEGLNAFGMGSRTKWYFWPNAAVREMAGLLKARLPSVLLVLAGTLVVFSFVGMAF